MSNIRQDSFKYDGNFEVQRGRREVSALSGFVEHFEPSYSTSPFSSAVKYVYTIPKNSKETIADLLKIYNEEQSKEINFDICNDIVVCETGSTSISPSAFCRLTVEEKNIVARIPNSPLAMALLQRV